MRSRDRIGLLVGAVAIRCFVLLQGSSEWLGERIEISTPVNQWKRGDYRFTCRNPCTKLVNAPYCEWLAYYISDAVACPTGKL